MQRDLKACGAALTAAEASPVVTAVAAAAARPPKASSATTDNLLSPRQRREAQDSLSSSFQRGVPLSYFEVLEFAALRGSSIANTSFGSREKRSECSDLSLVKVGGMSPFLLARFTLYSTKRFIVVMSPELETYALIFSMTSSSSSFLTLTRNGARTSQTNLC